MAVDMSVRNTCEIKVNRLALELSEILQHSLYFLLPTYLFSERIYTWC